MLHSFKQKRRSLLQQKVIMADLRWFFITASRCPPRPSMAHVHNLQQFCMKAVTGKNTKLFIAIYRNKILTPVKWILTKLYKFALRQFSFRFPSNWNQKFIPCKMINQEEVSWSLYIVISCCLKYRRSSSSTRTRFK